MNIKLLYDKAQIECAVQSIADKLNERFAPDGDVLCVCILRGATVFFADLVRKLNFNVAFDFLRVESYDGTERKDACLKVSPSEPFEGRNVIVVEDIIDSGATYEYLKNLYSGASSLTVVSLCVREGAKEPNLYGFKVGRGKFIVGYGMDSSQKMRNLDEIYYIEN